MIILAFRHVTAFKLTVHFQNQIADTDVLFEQKKNTRYYKPVVPGAKE